MFARAPNTLFVLVALAATMTFLFAELTARPLHTPQEPPDIPWHDSFNDPIVLTYTLGTERQSYDLL